MQTALDRQRRLERAGYRIEGPGDEAELFDRYWWTLYRQGWSGIECGVDFATREEALEDAWIQLQAERNTQARWRCSVRSNT